MQNDRDLLAAQSDFVKNTTIVGILDETICNQFALEIFIPQQ